MVDSINPTHSCWIIRISHECEGRIENPSRGSPSGITRLAKCHCLCAKFLLRDKKLKHCNNTSF